MTDHRTLATKELLHILEHEIDWPAEEVRDTVIEIIQREAVREAPADAPPATPRCDCRLGGINERGELDSQPCDHAAEPPAPPALSPMDWYRARMAEANDTSVQAIQQRDEARAEVARLQEELKQATEDNEYHEKLLTQLSLVKAGQDGDRGFLLQMQSQMWPLMVRAMAVWFEENGGKNHIEQKVELTAKDHTIGPFTLTLQRLLGKSPTDLRLEAEARAVELEAEAQALREQIAEFKAETRGEIQKLREYTHDADAPLTGRMAEILLKLCQSADERLNRLALLSPAQEAPK
jgi:hypothetical protein